MYNYNDTINSTQNSTINITQLMTSTTANRRSRFVNPIQALPVPEDEDIYVSLQVLQAQLKTQMPSVGTQTLLERVLSKLDKLQITVDNLSRNHKPTETAEDDVAESQRKVLQEQLAAKDAQLNALQARQKSETQDLVRLQDEVLATKAELKASHQKDMDELRLQMEEVRTKVEQQHDHFEDQVATLQDKISQLEAVQREKLLLEDKYKIEQIQNNELLRRNWFLESENNKLKKVVSQVKGVRPAKDIDKADLGYDTIIWPIEQDAVADIRAVLEQEQREKSGHAAKV